MKKFLTLLAVLCPTLLFGQSISYKALNLSQFYSNAFTVNIKTNAMLYGFTNYGNATLGGSNTLSGTTYINELLAASFYPGTTYSGITNAAVLGTGAAGVLEAKTSVAASLITWTTNAVNTGVIPVGAMLFTNLTGNITIAGLSGFNGSAWNTATLVATNGHGTDNYKITFPATCTLATNTFVIGQDVWVTNSSHVVVAIGAWAHNTNVAAARFQR